MTDSQTDSKTGNGGQSAGAGEPRTELSRDLGCFDITMIGVGAMIGAGIFVLTGIAAGVAGPALILAFALNGVITVFTAMVYAELGSSIPEAGGGYLWVKEGLPGGNAFLAGWMSWFAHAVAGSLYALGFAAYLQLMLEQFGWSIPGLEGAAAQKALAVAIALLFIYINYRGAGETGKAGNIVTVAKVVILLIFIVSGLWAIIRHPHFMNKFTPFAPEGLGGVFGAMGLTFIAFEDYEIIVQAGEEVKDPRRNVPRAVIWSMVIVLPLYILVAFVALGASQPGTGAPTWQWLGTHAEVGLVEAARQFMPFGTALLLIGGLLSTMSALNATTFSSTRVSFAMGRDHNLPDAFASIHPKNRTPWLALLASGGIIIGMAVAVPLQSVAAATDVMFMLLFLQVNVAAITIRRKYGDKLRYGYLTPFFPAIPIIGIVGNLALALYMFAFSPLAWALTAGWLAGGVVLWRFYARPREKAEEATQVLFSEGLTQAQKRKERFRVLLPVANPKSAEALGRFAGHIAKLNDGEVIVLHSVVLPGQLPTSAGRRLVPRSREVIEHALRPVRGMGVEASALVRVTHTRVWKAIADTVDEYKIDFLVMGWMGDRHADLGAEQHQVIKRSNCDVAVLHEVARKSRFRNILVPIAQPQQGELMINIARMLADPRRGQINLLHVLEPGSRGEQAQTLVTLRAMVNEMKDRYGDKPPLKVEVAESDNVTREIMRRAGECDLLVIESVEQAWLNRRLRRTRAEQIARHTPTPFVLVARRSGALKFNVQSFLQFFQDMQEDVEAQMSPAEIEAAERHKQTDADDGTHEEA
ncbi:MAG: hypothetical protein BIFFINMI_01662 [Phycisphaerae bacterium]|nr:hypothetical protein [Phycisphaerae bacterium]